MPRELQRFKRSRKAPLKGQRKHEVPTGTPQAHTSVEANNPSHNRTAISELCANFLVAVLQVPRFYPAPECGCNLPLSHFIARVLRHTRYDDFVAHGALILLQRVKIASPMVTGISGPALFIAALMVSSKWFFDSERNYRNKSWVSVAGNMYTLQQINQMERELYKHLDWNIFIDNLDLYAFAAQLEAKPGFEGSREGSPPLPSPGGIRLSDTSQLK